MIEALLPTEFHLEIYEPGSFRDVAISLSSPSPFMAMTQGDVIHTGFFAEERVGKRLRVVLVEHIVWDAKGHNAQKLCVYTEEVDEKEILGS